ncbi:MAG: gliding motility-associated C-terminal domain-containing protein [Janthinobacterium lividum]
MAAIENGLENGLHYSVIEMGLRGGLGDIGTVKEVAVPLPNGRVGLVEKLAAVPLPNGRDYWIIVHGWGDNAFYSFLLTPAGLQAVPVVSNVGEVHAAKDLSPVNATGYLRVSPDARRLAVAVGMAGVELFDFDRSTGVVSNAQPVFLRARAYYGLEFSADGSKLYVSDATSNLYQVDLANKYTAASIGEAKEYYGLLRGNDNRIYVSTIDGNYLAVISSPNAVGAACDFQPQGIYLGYFSSLGLPNFPNQAPIPVLPGLSIASPRASCAGAPVAFSATLAPAVANAVIAWNFGDPTAGAANAATGASVSHAYASAGTYTATATVALPTGTLTAQQTVAVGALPTLSLAPRQRVLCAGQALNIGASGQPAGTTYRWNDGLATATRDVRATGRYVLTVTSPLGCSAHDSVDVQVAPLPVVRLGRDTVLCAEQPAVQLSAGPQPAGTTYRWQDGSTAATFAALRPGRYRVEVRTAAGCTARDSVLVRDQPCPVTIPNIITPNGDPLNQAFVLRGLNAGDWTLALFDRWGHRVHYQEKYDNSWSAPAQPDGQYYYLLTNPATGSKYQGWLQVLR